ncbi:hypothetical protein ACLOJK_022678, partial [Asimina triloba]
PSAEVTPPIQLMIQPQGEEQEPDLEGSRMEADEMNGGQGGQEDDRSRHEERFDQRARQCVKCGRNHSQRCWGPTGIYFGYSQ